MLEVLCQRPRMCHACVLEARDKNDSLVSVGLQLVLVWAVEKLASSNADPAAHIGLMKRIVTRIGSCGGHRRHRAEKCQEDRERKRWSRKTSVDAGKPTRRMIRDRRFAGFTIDGTDSTPALRFLRGRDQGSVSTKKNEGLGRWHDNPHASSVLCTYGRCRCYMQAGGGGGQLLLAAASSQPHQITKRRQRHPAHLQ